MFSEAFTSPSKSHQVCFTICRYQMELVVEWDDQLLLLMAPKAYWVILCLLKMCRWYVPPPTINHTCKVADPELLVWVININWLYNQNGNVKTVWFHFWPNWSDKMAALLNWWPNKAASTVIVIKNVLQCGNQSYTNLHDMVASWYFL